MTETAGASVHVLEAAAACDATIASVEATPFRLHYASSVSLSDGVRETAEHILVAVTTSDGITGYAECIPRPGIYGETVATAKTLIESFLAPRIVGVALRDIELVASKLGALAANPTARSSVELAAIDALGKTLDVPAHRLLGGEVTEVHCSAILAYGEPEAVVEEARALLESDGVRMFKLKVGGDAIRDADLAGALRSELGDDAVVYADANGRYSADDAIAFLERSAEFGLWGLEEPTAASDLEGRERVTREATPVVIGDETCTDPRSVAVEVAAGRSNAVSIKIARTAVVASTRIREHCSSVGAPIVIGTQADSAIGAYTAAAFAASSAATADSPAEVLFFRSFARNLVTEPPLIRDGKLFLSDRPGFGFDIDRTALEECAIR